MQLYVQTVLQNIRLYWNKLYRKNAKYGEIYENPYKRILNIATFGTAFVHQGDLKLEYVSKIEKLRLKYCNLSQKWQSESAS